MAFDAKRLSPFDWGIFGAGFLCFIALFLDWRTASYAGYSAGQSGWGSGFGVIGYLLLLAAAIWWFLVKAEVKMPELPWSPLAITVAAAGAGWLIVILRWITMPRLPRILRHAGLDYGAGAGLWMAAILGFIEVACAVMLFRKSGESLPWQTSSASASPPAAPNPPPAAPES
jgi:hypothetical protein